MCRFDMNVAVKIGATFFRFRRGKGEYKENQEPNRLSAYYYINYVQITFYICRNPFEPKGGFRTASFSHFYMIQYYTAYPPKIPGFVRQTFGGSFCPAAFEKNFYGLQKSRQKSGEKDS